MRIFTLLLWLFSLSGAFAESPVTHAYGPDPLQKLDVYAPADLRPNTPIMIMVHGGAWAIGDKSNRGVWQNKQAHWGEKGYVFVSVNYRLLPEAPLETQVADVAAAVRFVQTHARDWGGEKDQIVLAGHSAGAHLVAMVAANPAGYGLAPWLATLVLDSAALDVPALMSGKRPARYARRAFGDDPDRWSALSPAHQVSEPAPAHLVICAKRRTDSCTASRKYAQELSRNGAAASILPVDMTHSQINTELGAPNGYTKIVDRFLREQGLP